MRDNPTKNTASNENQRAEVPIGHIYLRSSSLSPLPLPTSPLPHTLPSLQIAINAQGNVGVA